MSLPALDNLVHIGQLKAETPNKEEAKRNLAEYEGFLEIEASTIAEMCDLTEALITDVAELLK